MRHAILMTTYLFLTTFFCGCEKSNIADYTISPNSTFTITMISNISSGYSWHWENKERKGVVDSLKIEYIDEEEGRGKDRKEIWTFIAKKKGTEKLVFVYKRSWETTYETEKIFLVKVE